MSVTDGSVRERRSTHWIWFVLVCAGYVLLLGSFYLLLVPDRIVGLIALWPVLDLLLVAVAGHAAWAEFTDCRSRRSVRLGEKLLAWVVGVVVLVWVTELVQLFLDPERLWLPASLVVLPVGPVSMLCLLGVLLRRD